MNLGGYIIFTKNSINETCFYGRLVDIANEGYYPSAHYCWSFFESLVEYLESNNIARCSNCGYFFNYDEEGFHDDDGLYYCDGCKPTSIQGDIYV